MRLVPRQRQLCDRRQPSRRAAGGRHRVRQPAISRRARCRSMPPSWARTPSPTRRPASRGSTSPWSAWPTAGAGKKPTVTFTVKDNSGNGIPMSSFTVGLEFPLADHGGSDQRLRLYQLRVRRDHSRLCHRIGHLGFLQLRRHLHIHVHARRSGQSHRHLCDRHRRADLDHAAAGHHLRDDHQLRRSQPGNLFFGGRFAGDAAPHRGRAGQLQCLPRLPGSPRQSAQQRRLLRALP